MRWVFLWLFTKNTSQLSPYLEVTLKQAYFVVSPHVPWAWQRNLELNFKSYFRNETPASVFSGCNLICFIPQIFLLEKVQSENFLAPKGIDMITWNCVLFFSFFFFKHFWGDSSKPLAGVYSGLTALLHSWNSLRSHHFKSSTSNHHVPIGADSRPKQENHF